MVPQNDEATVDTSDETAGDTGDSSGDASEQSASNSDQTEAKTPAERPQNRTERRKNALREASDRADKYKADYERLQRETEATRRELAEMRGRMDEQARANQQSQPSQHDIKLKNLRSQWETHAAASQNQKLDAATRQQHLERAWEIENEMAETQFLRVQEKHKQSAPPDDSAQRIAAAQEEQYLEARFPWLEGNKRAHGFAWTEFEALVAEGRPRNRATMVQACTTVAAKFGFGGQNGNGANANSRRYATVPSGEGAGGEESTRGAPPKTDGNYRLAMGLYPELGKEAAFAKWSRKMTEKRGD